MSNAKYLIIGNGMTGLSAVKEIRRNDETGSVIVVTNEPYHTYFRVKLTEFISKEYDEQELLVNSEEWYKENNIQVRLRKIVENVDYDNNIAYLDDGEEIKFEKILLATGSRPFIPPIEGNFKKGFLALRSLKDLSFIKEYLQERKRVAVIGGGLLGLEAAWSLKELGKEVSIIEFAPHLLNRQLDAELSTKLEEQLREKGFNLYLDVAAEEMLGEDNRVDGLRLSNGDSIDVDAVLVSSGVRPDLDLVINTPVKNDRGIKVNNKLETNIEGVYAAGDVAQIGETVLGLWTAANEQGRVAGANMCGGDREYNVPKLFASLDIGDIQIFSAGQIADVDKVYEYKTDETHNKIFVKDGKMVGSILYGETKPMGKYRKAVFEKENIEEFLEENELKDCYK